MIPDWSPTPAALAYADFSDPQTLNLYNYTRNNPLSKPDIDGHCPWCIGAAVGAAVGLGTYIAARSLTGQPVTWTGALIATAAGALGGATFGALTAPEAILSVTASTSGSAATITVSTAGVGTTLAAGGTAAVVEGVAKDTLKTGSFKKAMSDPAKLAKTYAKGVAGAAIGAGQDAATESLNEPALDPMSPESGDLPLAPASTDFNLEQFSQGIATGVENGALNDVVLDPEEQDQPDPRHKDEGYGVSETN